MRKLTVILLFISLAAATAGAQQRYNMSGEPVFFSRNEVSLAVGAFPATDFQFVVDALFNGKFSEPFKRNPTSAAVTLTYSYRLSEITSYGASVSYSKAYGDLVTIGKATKTYYSIMPMAKFNWYNSGRMTLYSKVQAGVTIMDMQHSFDDEELGEMVTEGDYTASFIFQLSPIGIELGREIAWYAEAGFGAAGTIQMGVRYRF